jgi:type III restriction enzyme
VCCACPTPAAHTPGLNRAYAHVTEASTGAAANALADRLIDGMGFDPLDMASMIAPQLPLALTGGAGNERDDGPLFRHAPALPPLPALTVDVPIGRPLPSALQDAVGAGLAQVSSEGDRQRVRLEGHVGDALAAALVEAQPRKLRDAVVQQLERHNALVAGSQAPASRGETFAPVPRLAYRAGPSQGSEQLPLALLEVESVRETVALDLLSAPITIEGFSMVEQGTQWELYLDGQKKLAVGRGDPAQLPLDGVQTSARPEDLARWLANELQHPSRNAARDVQPAHLRAFTLACVNHLMQDQRLPLSQLVRHQYPLMQRLALCIDALREAAGRQAFRQLVLDGGWQVEADPTFEFRFDPQAYPVPGNKRYGGKFRMTKHFYPVVADLEDGSEEMLCALAIDSHPKVKRWVRNLDSEPEHGFWLPTSFGRFYPDFVCELTDGRVLVAEYKGEHLRQVPREIEKHQVGMLWAERSAGRPAGTMGAGARGRHSAGQRLDDLAEQRPVAVFGLVAGQRVLVGGEGGVELGPVGLGEQALGGGNDLLLFAGHVLQVRRDVAFHRLLEGVAARFAHHLEGQQRVFQVADGLLAGGVVAVELVEHRRQVGARWRSLGNSSSLSLVWCSRSGNSSM